MKDFLDLLRSIAIFIASIAIVVALWYWRPDGLTAMMDANLAIIKFVGRTLMAPYGAMTESALRLLAGEKALLFFETALLIRLSVWLFKRLLVINHKK